MTEHTAGFYLIEKYRIEQSRKDLHSVLRELNDKCTYNRGVLHLMEKYTASQDNRLSVMVALMVSNRRVQEVSDEYANLGFELMDVNENLLKTTGPYDEVECAENKAYKLVQGKKMSPFVRLIQNLKTRFK